MVKANKKAVFVDTEDRKVEVQSVVSGVISRLSRKASDLEGRRRSLEEGWLRDARQLYGRYDEETEKNLKNAKHKSNLFVKETGPKAKVWIAKLTDLLFPTDDKNWGLSPTPVPELIQAIEQMPNEIAVEETADKANLAVEGGANPVQQQAELQEVNENIDKGQAAQKFLNEAVKRTEAMERECEDQLIEGLYSAAARRAIQDAVNYGTGIIKGPYVSGKPSLTWVEKSFLDEESGEEVTQWVQIPRNGNMPKPSFSRVDFWSFFPDDNAISIEDVEFTYERHLLNKKQLKKWARRKGFDKAAIRRVLEQGTKESVPTYLARLRTISTPDNAVVIDDKFVAWEYRGPLEADEVQNLFEHMGDDQGLKFAKEADPLDEISVVVYFIDNEVIKFGINPFESEESIYSTYNFIKDEASPWGYGLPWVTRDSQRAINSSWRMIMDNGSLSVSPQIIMDKARITPANDNWNMTPNKTWYVSGTSKQLGKAGKAFETFSVPSNQTELANIFSMAKENMEEEASLPSIVMGDLSATAKTTFGGAAIAQTNSTIVFKLSVRHFDDGITTTILRRLYDWNMQFNPKSEIKGDAQVDARGSSVLLVREIQNQNLMIMLDRYSSNAALEPLMKVANTFRKVVQSMSLDAENIVKTDVEIEKDQAEAQKQAIALAEAEGEAANPEAIKLKIAELEAKTRLEVAEIQREVALIRANDRLDEADEDRDTKVMMQERAIESGERKQAAEITTKKVFNDQRIAAGDQNAVSRGTSHAS